MSSDVNVVDLRGGVPLAEPSRGRTTTRHSLKKKPPTVEIRQRRADGTVSSVQPPSPVSILQRPGQTYAHTGPSTPPQPQSYSQSQPQPQPREQVLHVARGHPLIIVDERRDPNTPLPIIIRNGKVVSGDARHMVDLQSHNIIQTIVRSEDGGSVYRNDSTVARTPKPRTQSVSDPKSVSHGDPPLKRSGTWGHSQPKEPPFLHPPHRTRSNLHGLRDIWLGWLSGARDRMERGRVERENAKRERAIERENRKRDFKNNMRMFKSGRKNAPLVY